MAVSKDIKAQKLESQQEPKPKILDKVHVDGRHIVTDQNSINFISTVKNSGDTFLTNTKVAGRLKMFPDEWSTLSSDPEIHDIINGVHIDFCEPPSHENQQRQHNFSKSEEKVIDKEILNLFKKNVIEKVEHCENEYISNIFLTKKKDGSNRPIINLKGLNTFVTQKHFKMESLQSIKHLIHKNCFFASVDLKDAYFTVPVAKVHRKYLRFEWKGNLYEFTCLCFRLSSAPRIFTKLMKPVIVCLRRQGYTLVIYLNDMLIIADSYSECLSALCDTIKLLTDLGFVINVDKSNLTPSQRIEFLGFIFDSTNLSISLPQEKIQKLTDFAKYLLCKDGPFIRDVTRLIGLMISSFPAFEKGKLFYRRLEIAKTEALSCCNNDFDFHLSIFGKARDEISWWVDNISSASSAINHGSPEFSIKTDASLDSWGATLNSSVTGGRWTQEESEFHINCLELLACFLALNAFFVTILTSMSR